MWTDLLANLDVDLTNERFETLLRHGPVRMERILSRGHSSPPGFWYDQEEEEAVLLLSGAARLRLRDPDQEVTLAPGQLLVIPAHRPHRVEWTAPDTTTVWLAIFYR